VKGVHGAVGGPGEVIDGILDLLKVNFQRVAPQEVARTAGDFVARGPALRFAHACMTAVTGEADEVLGRFVKGGWPPRRAVYRALACRYDYFKDVSLCNFHRESLPVGSVVGWVWGWPFGITLPEASK